MAEEFEVLIGDPPLEDDDIRDKLRMAICDDFAYWSGIFKRLGIIISQVGYQDLYRELGKLAAALNEIEPGLLVITCDAEIGELDIGITYSADDFVKGS